MQPPFTDCTRAIIQQAQNEARSLNQEFVGTEHIALSLSNVGDCDAMKLLHTHHVKAEAVRSTLLGLMPRSAAPPVVSGDLPLSPKAQRAINSAIVAAQTMRSTKISTRALLLALIEDDRSPFVSALRQAGADIDVLRQAAGQPAEDGES